MTKYVERYLLNRPEKEPTKDYSAILKGNYSPNIAWLIGQGADKEAIHAHILRFEADGYDGEKTVNEAIAVVRGKLLIDTNFKPKKGVVAYAFGTFYKVNPSTIGLDAEKLRIKYQEQQREKEKTIYWTELRVYNLFLETTKGPAEYLRAFFFQEDLNLLTAKYKTRQLNAEGQLKMDIDAAIKKNRVAKQGSN